MPHAIAETERHDAVWVAWPHRDWGSFLEAAQRELVDFVRALATDGGEHVCMLVASPAIRREAEAALADAPATLVDIPYGDIWTRDTGPFFLRDGAGLAIAGFAWNGWGGKYLFEHDDRVARAVAERVGARCVDSSLVCEGGALEVDGEGTCLTTRDCLLSESRNPGRSEADVSRELERALGVEKVLWLDGMLENDHTDGHVDTLARFVAPGRVVCMEPADDDPNRAVLEQIRADLGRMTDARGRPLEVLTIPSPGRVLDDDGEIMPASYANFFIANEAVLVPTYGVPGDADAVDALTDIVGGRPAIGVAARALLTGGGALHCITREQPAVTVEER